MSVYAFQIIAFVQTVNKFIHFCIDVISVLTEEVGTQLSIITALQACMILTMLGFVLGMVLMLVVMFRGSMKEARRHVLGWLCLITWVLTGRYTLVDLIDPIITTFTTFSDTRTHVQTQTNTHAH